MANQHDLLDGIYPAVVTSSADPLKVGRVKVRFPWMHDAEESHWARLVRPYAGKERGLFFVPEVGDEVLVAFELGDIHQPLVLGATWNGADEPPEPGDPDGSNHHKVIETRSGHTLCFDDTPGSESIQLNDSSLNNIVRWDTANDSITVTAQTGDIIVKAPTGKISLLAKEINIQASNNGSRKVGGNETTTVTDGAIESEGTSKTWTSSTKLASTAKTVGVGASSSMSMSGGSAEVECKQCSEDKITVAGATTDTCGTLSLEAEHAYEKADTRTWTVGMLQLHAPSVSFDASGPITVTAGAFTASPKGQFSLLGNLINLTGAAILLKAGQVQFNNKSPVPPGPGISAASAGGGGAFRAGL